MLTIWGRKTSSNVQALMWCVGELGLDYTRHDAGHIYGVTDTAEFRAMNPNGTVPVLQDGLQPALWETGAILRYLGARYGTRVFWPDELLARTEVDRWTEWAKINVALKFTAPVFWRVVRTPEKARDWLAIRQAVGDLEQALGIAEQRLAAHPYLVGEAFTLADIQFGHTLYRYFDIGIKRANLPHIAAYYDRLAERPAFREHVMVSYAELAV